MEFQPLGCKINDGLNSLLGKWKIPVLIQLRANAKMRFSDIQRSLPEITKKMLSQTLRELEEDDSVARKVYPTVPPKVEYSLTPHGQELESTLDVLHVWGLKHAAHLQSLQKKSEKIKLSRKTPLHSFENLVYYYLLEKRARRCQ